MPLDLPPLSSLPVRIEPCPIIESVFETRFVSTEPWATLPGLFHGHIRERYPDQVNLPLLQVPESVRTQDARLAHLPLIQFKGEIFLVQLGPRVVSLVTKQRHYPGWSAILEELSWLLEKVRAAGFIHETERLGVRYMDYFSGDVFQHLRIGVQVNGQPLQAQADLATVLHFGKISARLQITNGAIVAFTEGPRGGSVLDNDCWIGTADVDLFGHGLEQFTELHDTGKRLFFGLLKPEFLSQLNPVYA